MKRLFEVGAAVARTERGHSDRPQPSPVRDACPRTAGVTDYELRSNSDTHSGVPPFAGSTLVTLGAVGVARPPCSVRRVAFWGAKSLECAGPAGAFESAAEKRTPTDGFVARRLLPKDKRGAVSPPHNAAAPGWSAVVALICLLAFALAPPLLASAIQQAEVRIDGGAVHAMSLVVTNSRPEYWEGNFSLDVSSANLSVGPHWLEVRMQGDNGVWSAWQGQWFRIAGQPTLIAAEWFVDSDPGGGQGRPISLPADGAWDEAEEDLIVAGVEALDLSVGYHTLFVRCQDSDGNWGLTSQTVFYVAEPLYLVAAEWTSDPNTTPGSGRPMRAADGKFDEPEEDLLATGTADELGAVCSTPSIYVRVKDSLGRWSTRHGLYWAPGAGEPGGTWAFDPVVGWAKATIANIPVPPALAANPSPPDFSPWVNPTVTLDWNDCPGVAKYEVFFWRLGQPVTVYQSLGERNSYVAIPAAALNASGAYCWQVRSVSENGCYIDGPVWCFLKPGAGDMDGDGMADDWETRYFGWVATADITTDHDDDGIPDWQEYIAGTDPTNELDYFRIEQSKMVFPPSGLSLSWISAPDRKYTVFSTDKLLTPCEAGRESGHMYPVCTTADHTIWTKVYEIVGDGSAQGYTNVFPGPKGKFFQVSVGLATDP